MRNIVETLAAAGYVATDQQVEQLAGVVVQGNTANGTYLRVLLVKLQANLGRPRGGRPRRNADVSVAQDEALTRAQDALYVHVLAGVGPEDLDKIERHRRAAFARSAASTLRLVIRAGIDARTLDAETVTKNGLRKMVQPPEPSNRIERSLQRAEASLLRALTRMARASPEAAAEALERIRGEIDSLEDEAVQRPDVGATTVIATRGLARTPHAERPGAQLHRAAG